MKLKKQEGVMEIDAIVGILIFTVATAVILSLYLNILRYIVDINIHEIEVAYVTDIFEKVDYYD